MLGVTCDGLASHPGGIAILLGAVCYENSGSVSKLGLESAIMWKPAFLISIMIHQVKRNHNRDGGLDM